MRARQNPGGQERLELAARQQRPMPVNRVAPEFEDALKDGVSIRASMNPILQTVRGTTEGMLARMSEEERAFLEEEAKMEDLNPVNPWTLAVRGHPIREGSTVHKLWPSAEYMETPELYGNGSDVGPDGQVTRDKRLYPPIPENWQCKLFLRQAGSSVSVACAGCQESIRDRMMELQRITRNWEEIERRHGVGHQVDCTHSSKVSDSPWSKFYTRIPCYFHTCVLSTAVSPDTRSFAISRGSLFTEGLRGHSVGLRLRVGINLPWDYSRKKVYLDRPHMGSSPDEGPVWNTIGAATSS